MKIRHKLYGLCFALTSCSSAYAASNYDIKTEISGVTVYPQSSASPSSVSYTELLINIPTDMSAKPSCAARSDRFIIDSRNPLFDHVLSIALAARIAKQPVNINYWNVCEDSGSHKAPIIRYFTL
ncbi:hypothetical protein [Vibrio ostreicida]|uniref:hypothetical protein n=1 Tax=Vibrio ostreicida TaxID=526588 RepID=UPI00097079FC|nr:hypothetical protein [Vibrio ostreicida]